jgi:hypothetical protein
MSRTWTWYTAVATFDVTLMPFIGFGVGGRLRDELGPFVLYVLVPFVRLELES